METITEKAINHRIRISNNHDPKSPDSQGWGWMAIIGIGGQDKCAFMPITRQAALDTLSGMAQFGAPTNYSDCICSKPCNQCPIATKKRDAWKEWHIREDNTGLVWLLGDIEKGFAGFGYYFKSWASLMADIEVPMLKRMSDEQGFYWVAAWPLQK